MQPSGRCSVTCPRRCRAVRGSEAGRRERNWHSRRAAGRRRSPVRRRGADRDGQRIQAAHQQAPGPGSSRARTPRPASDARRPVFASPRYQQRRARPCRRQRRAPGQLSQQQPARRTRPTSRHPQRVQVIDAIHCGDHPPATTQSPSPRHPPPAPAAHPNVLCHQIRQTEPLRQRHHRYQTCARHQIRVIKRRRLMQQSHLMGAPPIRQWSLRHSHRPWSRGTFRANAPYTNT